MYKIPCSSNQATVNRGSSRWNGETLSLILFAFRNKIHACRAKKIKLSTLLWAPSVSLTAADSWTSYPLCLSLKEVDKCCKTALLILTWKWHPSIIQLLVLARLMMAKTERKQYTLNIVKSIYSYSTIHIQVWKALKHPHRNTHTHINI